MHTNKYLRFPSALNKVNYDMGKHSEFIVTSDQTATYNDLANCIIGTQPPYFVAKIHTFRTADKREQVAAKEESERKAFLKGFERKEKLAREAQQAHISVKDYIEETGAKYDEECDEMRMLAKVPGANIYLELLGCMDSEDTAMERWWQDERDNQPTDRAIDAAALQALNRMAVFVRATTIKAKLRQCATNAHDWQPRDDWKDAYDDSEYFPRPEKHGIGFDYVDSFRRPTPFVKHQLSQEEKDEYNTLKAEAMQQANRKLTADELAKIAQQAAANVAARKMILNEE